MKTSGKTPRNVRSTEFDLYMPPEKVFAAFANEPYAAFLDTGVSTDGTGVYSYIARKPCLVLRAKGNSVVRIENRRTRSYIADPLDELMKVIDKYRIRSSPAIQGLVGGLIGYLGYELGSQIERLPLKRKDDLNAPDMYFALYDTILAYNHLSARWSITSFAKDRLADLHREILQDLMVYTTRAEAIEKKQPSKKRRITPNEVKSNFTKAKYVSTIKKAKKYIREGDIYQVNVSQRFSSKLPCEPWDLYLRLRKHNPAPYSCYLKFPELIIASSSPELFLRMEGRDVITRPIKGTISRGIDKAEDKKQQEALHSSEKDNAELSMIVDLERNDLGRVCEVGSVKVDEHRRIEKFATVFHTISTVSGKMSRQKNLADLLRATFPGGSITGCPKIRSMEIIDELEPTFRGPYTGSIGYIGTDGKMDMNIAIRTFVIKGKNVSFQVGGGIVADSDPLAEYQETLDKGKALLAALLEDGSEQ